MTNATVIFTSLSPPVTRHTQQYWAHSRLGLLATHLMDLCLQLLLNYLLVHIVSRFTSIIVLILYGRRGGGGGTVQSRITLEHTKVYINDILTNSSRGGESRCGNGGGPRPAPRDSLFGIGGLMLCR